MTSATEKKVNFTSGAPIVGDRKPVLQPDDCQHPVALDECVGAAMHKINNTVGKFSTPAYRKAPLVLSRCARGGKTTMLKAIDMQLRHLGHATIFVSFNGLGFRMLKERKETVSEALYRVITNQIDSSLRVTEPRRMDWEALDAYISQHTRFVLLIDEINALGQKVGSELAPILKEYFLD